MGLLSFTITNKLRLLKMIPDIIDNSSPEKALANVLNELIRPESKVYIASGYFNLSGFKLLKDKIKDASEVSIIIGRALSPKDME